MKIGNVEIKRYDYKYEDFESKESKTNFITYVDCNDIPIEYKEEFEKWMYGQTIPVIPGVKMAVYSWDWERWYNLKTKGIPTYFD